MSALEALRERMPEAVRDIKLNLQAVMQSATLSSAQRYGVAIATAAAARDTVLRDALITDATREVDPGVIEDAIAAAALMMMTNVYYRFRHLVGKASYGEMPARLRMNRLAHPAASKLDFELYSLAVSAINGCETCVQAHERVLVAGGLTEQQIHDAVRLAAVVNATACARLAPLPASAEEVAA
jgi:lipoyl-dependent peroxiredoxin subunit D